jgi:NhaA family Na+:H+ antiporter
VSRDSQTSLQPTAQGRPPPIDQLLAPLREFTNSNASGGILLLAAGVVALVWANSPWAPAYEQLFDTTLTIGLGEIGLSESLHHWINDGLMAVFFLLVGLEIKREVLVGELASVRRAVLPVAAALGGATLPALIYVAITLGAPEAMRGWGVPMATDIAFALGALALLGSRVPLGLRVFVTALAIADDLLAVLVIAIFYSGELNLTAIAAAGGVLATLVAANRLGVRRPVVYAVLGLGLWLAFHESGVHATVAGVLLALTIPSRTRIDAETFQARAEQLRDEVAAPARERGDVGEEHAALWELEAAAEQAQAPMLRMEHALQPWVAFGIVPLFALANAGVTIPADVGGLVTDPIVLGIVLGLVLGKQVGITLAAWLVVRTGLADLPGGVSWRHIYGAAWLCGIGFTMALFIGELAFGDSEALDAAKLGILAASLIAGIGGFLVLRTTAARTDQ